MCLSCGLAAGGVNPDKVTETTVSQSISREIIVATTAGFTDKVEGHALITNDERGAFNKALNDWNIMDHEHTGYKVDHGHGLWSIR